MRIQAGCVLARGAALSLLAAPAAGVTIFESAGPGPTGQTSGFSVDPRQFMGVRFEVTTPVTTHTIGGHFGGGLGENEHGGLFGAIVALSGPSDFPDSPDLSTPDLLGAVVFDSTLLSVEVAAPLSLPLVPGHSALVFGSGLFGATETGLAPSNNSEIGRPAYIWLDSGGNWRDGGSGMRFFVTSAPEPGTAALVMVGLCAPACGRRRAGPSQQPDSADGGPTWPRASRPRRADLPSKP